MLISAPFSTTDEQRALRDAVADVLARHSSEAQVRALMATDTGFDPAVWRELAAMGLTGLLISEEYGGADPQIAVPARHDDLSGLPPAWIGVGTHDLFHEEDVAYAERLTSAGVPCQVEVVSGAFHGFDQVLPKAAVSQAFFASQCASLRAALAPTG